MIKLIVFILVTISSYTLRAENCVSTATIIVKSSNYSGSFDLEFRKGTRPGSQLLSKKSMQGPGTATFENVCPGTYFIAFGTPESPDISTTRYFDVINDGYNYSNPVLTIVYTHVSEKGSQQVGTVKKNSL